MPELRGPLALPDIFSIAVPARWAGQTIGPLALRSDSHPALRCGGHLLGNMFQQHVDNIVGRLAFTDRGEVQTHAMP